MRSEESNSQLNLTIYRGKIDQHFRCCVSFNANRTKLIFTSRNVIMTRTDWNSFRFYGWYSEHCIALVLGYGYVHFSMYIVFNFQRIDGTSPPQNDIKPMLRSPLKAWEKNQSKIEANRKKQQTLDRFCFFFFFGCAWITSYHSSWSRTKHKRTPSHAIPSHLFIYRCTYGVISYGVTYSHSNRVFIFFSRQNSSVCS